MKERRDTYNVNVGGVVIGSSEPVRIQSMTNTPTEDSLATANQIKELTDAGSELVRVTVNNEISAENIIKIRDILYKSNYTTPIIGDFHYNAHTLLSAYPETAAALDKYRLNPGNIGGLNKFDDNFAQIIAIAIKNDKPVRIGGNWGSLSRQYLENTIVNGEKSADYESIIKEGLIDSVLKSAKYAEDLGLQSDKIILSCKVSSVSQLVDVYSEIATKCKYPLHLGLTEAGMGDNAVISSVAAISILLNEGIGDTIRVSLTPDKMGIRTKEVEVCKDILSSLNLKQFKPKVISCPGCGRTSSNYFIDLTKDINKHIDNNMLEWKSKYIGVENINIAVMGCIVNGPGESKHANIGISLPGTNESPSAPVFIDGEKVTTLKGDHIRDDFIKLVEDYISKKYKKVS
ncbi:MAG: flavodoxin-dependent (E)-4-hydroxy-3-methylbut-2-enyl-diphosphate synthase [Gammaproteobacteria bacterium]|nr:flavodoxin-dependent (E)-4-hydroxy-3-methylbut-2-enyl-diphosphate synthase [Gammaproteobacteria bacterium]